MLHIGVCYHLRDKRGRKAPMKAMITSEMLTAYSHCPRKAYLLLFTDTKGIPHEYECILDQQKSLNQRTHIDALRYAYPDRTFLNGNDLSSGRDLIFGATLKAEKFGAVHFFSENRRLTRTRIVSISDKDRIIEKLDEEKRSCQVLKKAREITTLIRSTNNNENIRY